MTDKAKKIARFFLSLTAGIIFTAYLHTGNFKLSMFRALFQQNLWIVLFFWAYISGIIYLVLNKIREIDAFDRNSIFTTVGELLLSVCFIYWMAAHTVGKFYYDTGIFASQAEMIEKNGLSFDQSYDRYFYHSFFLMIGHRLFFPFTRNPAVCYTLIISVFYCFACWLMINRIFPIKKCSRKLIALGLILTFSSIFIKEIFIYPLTDAPALSLAIICIALLTKVSQNSEKPKDCLEAILQCLICGATLYFIHGIRPIYQVLIPFFIFGLILNFRHHVKNLAVVLFCMLIGFLWAGIPLNNQTAKVENKPFFDVYSPLIQNQPEAFFNVNKGMESQLWITYTGTDDLAPNGKLFSYDSAGGMILSACGKSESYSDILQCAAAHPMDVLGLLQRHLIVMLFPISSVIEYVPSMQGIRWPFILVMFLIYFISLTDVFLKIRRKRITRASFFHSPACIFTVPLIFLFLFSLPSVPVYRYAVPVYFLSFFYFFGKCDFRPLISDIRHHPELYFIFFFTSLSIVCMTLGTMLSSIVKHPMLIH